MTEAQTVPKIINCTADAETAYSAAMQGINLSVSDAEQPDAANSNNATIPTNSFVFKILLQFFKLNTYLDGNIPNSYFSVTVRIITYNTEKASVKQVDPEPRSYLCETITGKKH